MGARDQAVLGKSVKVTPNGLGGDLEALGQFGDPNMRAKFQFQKDLFASLGFPEPVRMFFRFLLRRAVLGHPAPRVANPFESCGILGHLQRFLLHKPTLNGEFLWRRKQKR